MLAHNSLAKSALNRRLGKSQRQKKATAEKCSAKTSKLRVAHTISGGERKEKKGRKKGKYLDKAEEH